MSPESIETLMNDFRLLLLKYVPKDFHAEMLIQLSYELKNITLRAIEKCDSINAQKAKQS